MRPPTFDVVMADLRRRLAAAGVDPEAEVVAVEVRIEADPATASQQDSMAEVRALLRRATSGYPPFA